MVVGESVMTGLLLGLGAKVGVDKAVAAGRAGRLVSPQMTSMTTATEATSAQIIIKTSRSCALLISADYTKMEVGRLQVEGLGWKVAGWKVAGWIVAGWKVTGIVLRLFPWRLMIAVQQINRSKYLSLNSRSGCRNWDN
jgi:hypothetical protein